MKLDRPLTLTEQQLVADHFSLISYFCYLKKIDYEEFCSDLSLVLIKSAETYPENADFKFQTHAMRNFNYYLKNIYRKRKSEQKKENNTSYIEDLTKDGKEPQQLDDYSSVLIVAELQNKLTSKEFNLFYLWYFKQMTYTEIGKLYGVSHQRIGKQMKKIFSKIQQIFK